MDFRNDEPKPVEHNVFSNSEAKRFDLGLYKPGEPIEPVTFEQAGAVRLRCSIHRYMDGVVYVTPTPFFAVVGQGRAVFDRQRAAGRVPAEDVAAQPALPRARVAGHRGGGQAGRGEGGDEPQMTTRVTLMTAAIALVRRRAAKAAGGAGGAGAGPRGAEAGLHAAGAGGHGYLPPGDPASKQSSHDHAYHLIDYRQLEGVVVWLEPLDGQSV